MVYWEHLEKRLYLCCLEMQAAGPFWREAGGDPKFISVKREVPTNAREDHTGLHRVQAEELSHQEEQEE